MSAAGSQEVGEIRSRFGSMHAVSSVMYALKMIAGLVWGLVSFQAKEGSTQEVEPT